MNPEEIEALADTVVRHQAQIWRSTIQKVAAAAERILKDMSETGYDWERIENAFGGASNLTGDAEARAKKTILARKVLSEKPLEMASNDLAEALRGLAYIVRTSGYRGLSSYWQEIQEAVHGAYLHHGIRL